ncbi:MAG: VCBS repeat-containing protein [Desulfobulbaceae bacterium]|nr:VCBS repeat-containing protein [Desulfobulbaceae bacterium]
MTKSFSHSLICTLLFFLFFSGLTFAGEETAQQSIAILPIKATAQKDISYLESGIRQMLASRLAAEAGARIVDQNQVDKLASAAQPLDQQQISRLGAELRATHILLTTLTAIGNSLSLDAKLYPVSGNQPAQTFYSSASTENDIIDAVDSLSWDIAEKSFGKQRPGAPQYAPQMQQAPAPVAGAQLSPRQELPPALPDSQAQPIQSPYTTAHPDRQFMQNHAGAPYGGSALIRPTAITGAFGFTKTQNLSLSIQGMDIGDIDGDGNKDVVVADKNKIIAYHLVNNRLIPFGEVETLVRYKIISLGLADLNGNGKDEIYVTSVDWITPDSFGVEWQGKAFDYVFKNERWFVKPMKVPGQGMVLAGQRTEVNDAFAPGIHQLRVTDNIIQSENMLPVPDKVNLYDFSLADLDADGKVEVIALDEFDKLMILQSNGKMIWKSDETYGGTLRYIGGESPKYKASTWDEGDGEGNSLNKNRIYIHSRIIIKDVNNDNLPDIIVNKNLSTASKYLQNMRNYPSGEIHGLAWNGIGMTQLWRTRKIDGYVSTYQLENAPDNKTAATLFVGLVMNSGWLDVFSAKDSSVLMYPLDFSEVQSPQNTPQGFQYMQQ